MDNRWELEEAKAALAAGELALAVRYLDKALEKVRCMYCHKGVEGRPTKPYYKGWAHIDCGRGEQLERWRDYARKGS